MVFISRPVRGGQRRGDDEARDPVQALSEERSTEQRGKTTVLEEVQDLVPYDRCYGRQRRRLRRQVEDDGHIGEWRQPEADPRCQTTTGHSVTITRFV